MYGSTRVFPSGWRRFQEHTVLFHEGSERMVPIPQIHLRTHALQPHLLQTPCPTQHGNTRHPEPFVQHPLLPDCRYGRIPRKRTPRSKSSRNSKLVGTPPQTTKSIRIPRSYRVCSISISRVSRFEGCEHQDGEVVSEGRCEEGAPRGTRGEFPRGRLRIKFCVSDTVCFVGRGCAGGFGNNIITPHPYQ